MRLKPAIWNGERIVLVLVALQFGEKLVWTKRSGQSGCLAFCQIGLVFAPREVGLARLTSPNSTIGPIALSQHVGSQACFLKMATGYSWDMCPKAHELGWWPVSNWWNGDAPRMSDQQELHFQARNLANLAMFAAMFASQQITEQILEFHHHYGYSYHFIPIHITTTPNPIPPRWDGRMECEFCGRKFNPASYERHQPICQKASPGTVPEGLANGYLVTLW